MTETRRYAASRAARISKNGPPLKITRSSCVRKGEGTKEQEEKRKKKKEGRKREERRKKDRKIRKKRKRTKGERTGPFIF